MSRKQLKTFITPSQLLQDFQAAGLQTGDTLMLHASLKKVGWLLGGPQIVLTSLQQVLGPQGTLMMYVGWEDSPYTMRSWPPELREQYRAECPAFDPRRSRAVRDWSVLAEVLRSWPGSRRSRHPDGSFCALGAQAAFLTRGHALRYGYGPHSPLGKLLQLKGKVLLLGSPLDSVTLLHHSETVCKVPDKRVIRYQMPVLKKGQKHWVDVEEYDTSKGIFQGAAADQAGEYFVTLMTDYLCTRQIASCKIGQAEAYLLDACDLNDYAVQWLENWWQTYCDRQEESRD